MQLGDIEGVNIDEGKTNLSTYEDHPEQVCTYDLRCCSKRQQTNSTSSISSRYYLPQEIVFQFLLNLPAHVLFNVMRHVCREWSLVIRSPNFAHQHLRNSTGGVLIQNQYEPNKGYYLEMRRVGGCIEICEFNCGFDSLVWRSCNGLVLISYFHYGGGGRLVDYVSNPLTKQLTTLPPSGVGFIGSCGLAAAFVEGFMVYKVVRACYKPQIQVLTIGVDKAWRHIDLTHLLLSKVERNFYPLPVVSGGYVHWAAAGVRVLLTLNIETEIIRRFSWPPLKFRGTFLPMGSDLSYVSASSESEHYMEVWEMGSVTGEWTMLCRISKRRIKDIFRDVTLIDRSEESSPVCWLVAREILFFGFHGRGITYTVMTGEIQAFEWGAGGGRGSYHFTPHVNSLVWCE